MQKPVEKLFQEAKRGDKSLDKKQSNKTGEGGSLPDNFRDSLG